VPVAARLKVNGFAGSAPALTSQIRREMHSHHSHSGQFCQHAQDKLEDVVKQAIAKNLTTFCLTEHMPRFRTEDLYPEEIETETAPKDLELTFEAYYKEAIRLQHKYSQEIELLVGFESESITPEYFKYVRDLKAKYCFDMCVGSVHHTVGYPIDYDGKLWSKALHDCGGTVEMLLGKYFDDQYDMIRQIKPDVISHFDLIRLKAPPGAIPENLQQLKEVWTKIVRNIKAGIANDCLFEVNSAALRKGWRTPYPAEDIARLIVDLGGKFCLSDDSHGVAQVAIHYDKVIDYLRRLGVSQVYYLTRCDGRVIQKPFSIESLE
jgi:histidinol-phosphatase (PHP family)